MKKVISLILVITILMFSMPALTNAEAENGSISETDVMLIASQHIILCIENDASCPWMISNTCYTYPLYDLNDNVWAYYVSVLDQESDNGYIVICASKENPSVIEYGYSRSPEVSDSSHTFYFTMGLFFNYERGTCRNIFDNKTYEITELSAKYGDITSSVVLSCPSAQRNLKELRTAYKNVNVVKSGGGWNILDELPTGVAEEIGLLSKSLISDYFVTSDFSGTNHCGPTSGMNVLKYYTKKLSFNLLSADTGLGLYDNDDIFSFLYTRMGNGGPTLPGSYRSALQTYINTRKSNSSGWSSVSISCNSQTKSYNNIKSNITNGRMAYLVIWNGLQAHYINVIGYYKYSTSENVYVRVINNWNRQPNYYYLFRTGASTYNSAISHMGYSKITK